MGLAKSGKAGYNDGVMAKKKKKAAASSKKAAPSKKAAAVEPDPEWEHLEERYSQIGSEMKELAKMLVGK